ncbi:MAG: flippase [Chloroflexi bacterium]|nr:MAG: flippase [Chloroflexota bacterium]
MTTDVSSPRISSAEAERAVRNATAIAVATILSKGILFGWQLVLAPLLGVASYGIYGTVLALFTVGASIPNFGMGPIVIRDVARKPQDAGRYLTSALFTQTILALIAYIAINSAALSFGYSTTIRAFVAVAGISLLIDIFGNVCHDILIGQERMLATSTIDIVHIVVRVGLAAFALFLGFGLMGVYIATIISGIGRALALWWMLLRGGVRPHWPIDRVILVPLIVNSAPLALSAFLVQAYGQADKLMTTRFIGEVGTGNLTAAFVIIAGMIELLSTTVLVATFPMMSRAYGDGHNPLFGFMVEKMAFFTIVISLPITLVLSLFAADITVPLFGEDFAQTADVLRILVWYAMVTMVANVFAQALMVQNQQRRLLMIRATGLAVNITLNALLLPRIGVRGAAIATVVAEMGVIVAMLSHFTAHGWDVRRLPPRLLRLTFVGGATLITMILLGSVHPIVGILIAPFAYIAGGLLLGVLETDDWDLLYRLVAAMPGGTIVIRYWKRDLILSE